MKLVKIIAIILSLESFLDYHKFKKINETQGTQKPQRSFDDSKDDFAVIDAFCSKLFPTILMGIYQYLDENLQVSIASDGTTLSRNFDFVDEDESGAKLNYDGFIRLEPEAAFSQDKYEYSLPDFKYYTITLDTSGAQGHNPRKIFIKGALSNEGKYSSDLLEEFSFTNLTQDEEQDGKVTYTNSPRFLYH